MRTHQRDYYDSLAGVHLRGRWTNSLGFFLDGIAAGAITEQTTAQSLRDIRRSWQQRAVHLRADAMARRRLGVVLGAPVQIVPTARELPGLSAQAANTGIAALLDLGILREATGRRWRRSFRAYEVSAFLEGEVLAVLAAKRASHETFENVAADLRA